MKLTRSILRRLISETLNQVSPSWREDPDRRFDVEATPTGHGHYGALNPDKKSPKEVESSVDEAAEEEFKKYAISEFDRIFKTDFYSKKLADAGGQFDFVADDTITRALSGDIMHGLLHEMLQKYIFEIFKEEAHGSTRVRPVDEYHGDYRLLLAKRRQRYESQAFR
jgi:hypothetical protein